MLFNEHFLHNQILYKDHRQKRKTVASFHEQLFLDKNTLICLWDYSKIYWLMEWQVYQCRKLIFSILYSKHANFFTFIKRLKEGLSVGISSIKIHQKQHSSSKNTWKWCTKIHACMDLLGSVLPYLNFTMYL